MFIVNIDVFIGFQFGHEVRYQTDETIKAAAVRVALNVEQLDAVPFDNEDSAWFHFGTAATAATFVVFVRRVVVCIYFYMTYTLFVDLIYCLNTAHLLS